MQPPSWQPLFDRVLAFAAAPRFERELLRAREHYFTQTGEVFDDDAGFDARLQAFLDWYVFDRPLAPWGETACRVYVREAAPGPDEARALRVLSRTVHGIFCVLSAGERAVRVRELASGAAYAVAVPGRLPGLRRGDLFEARLVPFEGAWHFSPAFIFHPPHLRAAVAREAKRLRREEPESTGQDLVWTLSRMALRCEHYRAVPVAVVYDFKRPPPRVAPGPLRSWNAADPARSAAGGARLRSLG